MMKTTMEVKDLIPEAAEALRSLLLNVPLVRSAAVENEPGPRGGGADVVIRVDSGARELLLVCEVKPNGQPRNVRLGLSQLKEWVSRHDGDAVPIFMAPYLSPEAQAICREEEAGYMDLHGNARLVFDGIFIERAVAGRPATERRELKSLFKPKSAQLLRVLLRDPDRRWRVAELAEAASVSLGHVSNIRLALLAREWARVDDEGLYLCDPGALLDAWRDEYEAPAGKRMGFYTTLHGPAFEKSLIKVLRADENHGYAVLSSFSAAQWMAPYVRTGSQYFYADKEGLENLKHHLKLTPVSSGENVVIFQPKETGVFLDVTHPADGIVCTSPVQTYLDLANAGERGQEAAEHLRREKLAWSI
jgi:hypothetical protein